MKFKTIFKFFSFIFSFFICFNIINAKKTYATNFTTIEKNVLTVGTNATFHPFEYRNEKDEIVGFDIDIINLIAKKLNIKVKIIDMPFDGLLAALGSKLDLVIAGLTSTEERKKIVNFSQSYFESKQAILTLKNKDVKNEESLKNLTIATQIGTTANEFIKNLQKKINSIKIKEYDEYDIMVQDLTKKRVDAVILDEIAATNQLNKHPKKIKLTNGSVLNCPIEDCCIASAKQNTNLIQAVDKALLEIKSTNELDKLIKKHMDLTIIETPKEDDGLKTQFYRAFIEKDRYKLYLKGLGLTLTISFFSAIVGIFLGIIIAIIKMSKNKNGGKTFFARIASLYVSLIRGTPVLVQLLIMWLIVFKSSKNGIFVAVVAFGLNSTAYVAEIIRGGIESVSVGQTQAGESLGFSRIQVLKYVVLPQGLKNSIPALCNEFISLIKETAIVGYVALNDLTRAAFSVSATSYQTFMPLILIAIIYFVITKIISIILDYVKEKI